MKKIMRTILLTVLALVVTAPLSVIITALLFPFWSWLESFSGIESVGHSGPAGWCYLLIFMALLAALAATVVLRIRPSRGHPSIQTK
jgi:H+/Cl- antiporter ClcA